MSKKNEKRKRLQEQQRNIERKKGGVSETSVVKSTEKEATKVQDSAEKTADTKSQPTETKLAGHIISLAILPVYYIFAEVIFRLIVNERVGSYALLPTVLFVIGYGIILSLLTGLIPNRRVTRVLRVFCMLIPAVFFLLEYYIYREFKMLYDVNTINNAALDVVRSNFLATGAGLVFSATGVVILLIYMIPILLYAVFAFKIDPCPKMHWKKVLIVAGVFVVCRGGAAISVMAVPSYMDAYDQMYEFAQAVDDFGFMTGIRLEYRNKLTGKHKDVIFLAEETTETATEASTAASAKTSTEATTTEEVKVYEPNELPLDFDELAANAPNSTIADMDAYVASQTASMQNDYTGLFEGKNLIMITAEAFTDEAIDPVRTPTLYRMATKGIQFKDYYQPASAGTTGGEVENIFGVLPLSGGATMNMLATHTNSQLISWYLNDLGYYGEAYHNNDYMFYDRNITHVTFGYSEGFMGVGNGMEEYISTNLWPESDLEMLQGTVERYINEDHFDIYYMSVSAHSAYSWSQNAMAKRYREEVADLEDDYSEPVLSYLASNMDLDRAMEYLINRLEEEGKADDTVIVISADHFPYGLDADSTLGRQPYLTELYGYAPENYMQRDHNRLIMWCGSLEDDKPIVVEEPVSSLDIQPTLLNLFGLPFDSRLYLGRDVFSDATPIVFNTCYDWKTDRGTYIASRREFTPAKDGDEVSEEYINNMNTIVKNKMVFNRGLISNDYYGHVLGDGALNKGNKKDTTEEE